MPISQKKQNKKSFQKSFKLKINPEIPLAVVFLEYFPLDAISILPSLMEGLTHLNMQLVVIEPSKALLKSVLQKEVPEKGNMIFASNDIMERLFEASDMGLFLAKEHQNLLPIMPALQAGVVPITFESEKVKYLKNYNPINENGNSFLFENFNLWEIFATGVRAFENYRFPYDWKNIVKAGKS